LSYSTRFESLKNEKPSTLGQSALEKFKNKSFRVGMLKIPATAIDVSILQTKTIEPLGMRTNFEGWQTLGFFRGFHDIDDIDIEIC
jgi:hypothetical protein